MKKIIVFVGEKKSGKDFFCSHLIERENAVRHSFSDEVRSLAVQLFPWLPFDFDPSVKDKPFIHPCNPNNLTPRDIWLLVGKVRDVQPDYFVRKFHSHVDFDKERLNVITDMRTPEEYQYLKTLQEKYPLAYDITFIKVVTPFRDGVKEDPFEDWVRAFDGWDFKFTNFMDGTEDFDEFINGLLG